ncbi:glycosyltransferase [Rubrivirga sp. S365]|uniref:Glycosyltransferase n=1 Tax=Rubrivirga litoralis TaxID=3075598 RepID=A0ABU3BMI7_9BACT|nr:MULTISPECIES: glycosyltransferase [unclassified Rubrivirga]MDT0630441.1 glycosyltransferase [Rubrivirga sp. F394]MDT7857580.1 glycosyltransferase [Rubrivirga sp. S365]
MTRRVLLIDPVSPDSYQARTLYDRALSAPEASVVRVAEGLAQAGHRVTVAQRGRTWPSRSPGGVAYVPFAYGGDWGHLPRAEAVVVVRQAKVLARTRAHFPDARLALWLHETPGSRQRALGPALLAARATAVCPSNAHRAALHDFLLRKAGDGPASAPSARVYSPVDDDLRPDRTAVDPDKLVAFAGPRGALDEVLAAFAHVRRRRPTARLVVLGGRGGRPALPEGAVALGPLPHRGVLRHVREAFAVFAPQTRVEGPLALAFAEANAVGTPVVAHPDAAACEALAEAVGEQRQLVDARDPSAAARRLARWWDEGRPEVDGAPRFRTHRVVRDWERLLGLDRTDRPALRVPVAVPAAPPVAVPAAPPVAVAAPPAAA